jgi:RNA polymerase sigma factor (sigma-70 family)
VLLVRQICEAPLADLARRMRPALVSYFLRRVRDPSEAEDLAHEVFIRLAGTRLDSLRSADAYVFQIAANLLNDRARRNKVREDYVYSISASGAPPEEALDPARIVAGRRSLSSLVARLRELPDRTREIFVLYRIENVKKTDIAAAYDVSVSTVEKEICKATSYLMLFREDVE